MIHIFPFVSKPLFLVLFLLMTVPSWAQTTGEIDQPSYSVVPSPKPVSIPENKETEQLPPETNKHVFGDQAHKTCLDQLGKSGARYTEIPRISGEPPCGVVQPVEMTGTRNVTFSAPATLTCPAALALAEWTERGVVPLAKRFLGEPITEVGVGTSYECRKRRGGTSTKYSEHSFGSGVDIHQFTTASGIRFPVRSRVEAPDEKALFQAAVRGSACAYFKTVLGPMSNAAHEDHFHFDMAIRKGDYRLCD